MQYDKFSAAFGLRERYLPFRTYIKIPELSVSVKSLEVVAASDSRTMNCHKTKTLSFTRNANGLVQVGCEQIEAVDKFTQLGSEIDASGVTDLNIKSRIEKARSALVFCRLFGSMQILTLA